MRALYRENTSVEKIPTEVLLGAYMEGVFPMSEDGEIYWFHPKERGIIPLDDRFHISRGLRRSIRKRPFEVRFDTSFQEVMEGCRDREETWIDPVIMESYCELFKQGFAHSVECWDEAGLQGGLYGVRLGRAFFGESMFSRKTDASKISLVNLAEWLREERVILLDTQWMTDHLRTFGGYEVSQAEYRQMLAEAVEI